MAIPNILKYIAIAVIIIGFPIAYIDMNYSDHVDRVSETGKFPEAFKWGYMKSCTTGDGKGTEEQCKCALNYFENNYTYREYLQIQNDEDVLATMVEECE